MSGVRVRLMTEPTALPEFQDFVQLNPGETVFDVVREALDGFEQALADVYRGGDAPAITSLMVLADPVVEAPSE